MSIVELEREVGENGEVLKAHDQRLSRIESCLDRLTEWTLGQRKESIQAKVTLAGIVLTFLSTLGLALFK